MNKRKIKKCNQAYWYLVRFKGDMAIYKICSNCLELSTANYHYDNEWKLTLRSQDNYCSQCGRHMIIHPICRRTEKGYLKPNIDITRVYEGNVSIQEIFS